MEKRSERSRFSLKMLKRSTSVPDAVYDREIARLASDPIVRTPFVQEELNHLHEIDDSPTDNPRPDEEVAREAIDRNVEIGNLREVEELIHVAVPDVVQRFDLVQEAHENNVSVARTENVGNVNHAQRLLDQFTAVKDRYFAEMGDVILQPGKLEVVPQFEYGDDD